jgi:ribosome-associated protein
MTQLEHENQFDENYKSKTALKNEMAGLQAMGKKLTELNADQIKQIPMNDELAKAIEDAKRIRQREATRRHLQYIGKLMRSQDIDAIQYQLDLFDTSSLVYAQTLHKLEKLREQLITGDQVVLTEYLEDTPGIDVTRLRQLIRNAQKEKNQGKNLGSAKKLFRYLKECEELKENPKADV